MINDKLEKIFSELHIAGLVGGVSETCIRQAYLTWILKPGYVTMDIGAHAGLHTFPMAEAVGESGKVYAFEANPILAENLRIKAEGGHPQIAVSNLAVSSNGDDSVPFYLNQKFPGQSTLIYKYGNNFTTSDTISVKTVTIDSYYEELSNRAFCFIKIDAEGAELEILKGARRILTTRAPLIAAEISIHLFRAQAQELFSLLKELDYSAFLLTGTQITKALLDTNFKSKCYTVMLAKNSHWTHSFCSDQKKMATLVEKTASVYLK